MVLALTLAAPSAQARASTEKLKQVEAQRSQMALLLREFLTTEDLSVKEIESLSEQLVDLMDHEKGFMAALKFTNTGVLVQNVDRLRVELETIRQSPSAISERDLEIRLSFLEKALSARLGVLNDRNLGAYTAMGATVGIAIGVFVGARNFSKASGQLVALKQGFALVQGVVYTGIAASIGIGVALGISAVGKTDDEAVQNLLD